jgi:hypothetical protein
MKASCYFPLFVIPLLIVPPALADEALNKLLAAHEQAERSAKLPLHRRLLAELQKMESQYQKGTNKIALAEVQAEIVKVKQQVADASQPVGSGAGPQPADFKIVYHTGYPGVIGSWENGDLKILPQGFSWTNKSINCDLMYTRVFTDAFEGEFTYKGSLYTFLAGEADYSKHVNYCFNPQQPEDSKHTIKLKRSVSGAMTAEVDGKPVSLMATPGARQDMHIRVGFRVLKDATVEFREITFKEAAKK